MHISLHSLFLVALSTATMIAADDTPNGGVSPTQIPQCGLSCAEEVAPQTACKTLLNTACQCSDTNYRNLILKCIETKCTSTQDQTTTIALGKSFCNTLTNGTEPGQASNGSSPSVGGGLINVNNNTSGGGSGSGTSGGSNNSSGSVGSGRGSGNGSGSSSNGGSSSGGSSGGNISGDNGGKSSARASSSGAIRLVASLGAVAVVFVALV